MSQATWKTAAYTTCNDIACILYADISMGAGNDSRCCDETSRGIGQGRACEDSKQARKQAHWIDRGLATGYLDRKEIHVAYILSGSNLGHVVVLAEPRQVRVEVLDSLLVRLEQLRPHTSRLGQLL